MEKEISTAQTTDVATATIDSNADVNLTNPQQEHEVNDAEFTDTPQGGQPSSDTKTEGTPAKKKQTPEENSVNARRRREAERQQLVEAAKVEAVIETLNGVNPYTNEPMKDAQDVEEYKLMKEIEQSGGDPITDYSKRFREKEREKVETAKKQAEQDRWFETDRQNFIAKHPDVNLAELTKDESFQEYAQGKVGVLPLTDIYEGYQRIITKFSDGARKSAAQIVANAKATPGSLSAPKVEDDTFFTFEQVQKMSPEDVHKNYDAIRRSMTKWNK